MTYETLRMMQPASSVPSLDLRLNAVLSARLTEPAF